MRLEAEGMILFEGREVLGEDRLARLASALDTTSAQETARLVPIFGPTVAGEESFVEAFGLDLSKALLGGVAYTWNRPFEAGEEVSVKLFVERVFDKGPNRFGVVVAEFTDAAGTLLQRQSATFIEASAA